MKHYIAITSDIYFLVLTTIVKDVYVYTPSFGLDYVTCFEQEIKKEVKWQSISLYKTQRAWEAFVRRLKQLPLTVHVS